MRQNRFGAQIHSL